MNNDLIYLNRRASEERRAAFKSQNREVAEIHRELANAYEFRVYLLKQMEALKADHAVGSTKADDEIAGTNLTQSPIAASPKILAV